MKTTRFTEIVKICGRPSVHLTWLKPESDPSLRRMLKANRVMTIHQTVRGTGADYGTVGLHLSGPTQILVFPRSLSRFADRRIVGIKYDEFAEPIGGGVKNAKPSRQKAKDAEGARDGSSAEAPNAAADSSPEEAKESARSTAKKASRSDPVSVPSEPPLTWSSLEVRLRAVLKTMRRRRTANARSELEGLLKDVHARKETTPGPE